MTAILIKIALAAVKSLGFSKASGFFDMLASTITASSQKQKHGGKQSKMNPGVMAGKLGAAGGNIKKVLAYIKIAAIALFIVIIVAGIAQMVNNMASIFNIFSTLTEYSSAWDYSSLDDKNLDTEVIAEDILYETFYEVISETSYYQVFNTKYTVAEQNFDFEGIRFKAMINSIQKEIENTITTIKSVFVASAHLLEDWLSDWSGFDNMDIRMTVHDANFRSISGLQKALSYSDNANPESASIQAELSLYRDYYGRENNFAVSTGLLKELNDKVLNKQGSNSNENTMIYPEAFTKPVQFSYDYYRVKPMAGDTGDITHAEDYTYITRRVLYEDISSNNDMWVTDAILGDSNLSYIDVKKSVSELVSQYNGSSTSTADDLPTDIDKFDLEGFITSAPTPYLYEYIVLERNSRKGLQNAAIDWDFLAMNNVSKYATIKEYNGYSENPTEKQIKLYWKIVDADGNLAIKDSNGDIDFTKEFTFTKNDDGRPVPKNDYGFVDKNGKQVFVFKSEEHEGLHLEGPFASFDDMMNNIYLSTDPRPLEGFDGKTKAEIRVGYDATTGYVYTISYDKYEVRRKIVKPEKAEEDETTPTTTPEASKNPTAEELAKEEEPVYYEWKIADTPKEVTITAEAMLTFPERHYQLADLENNEQGLLATGRVYVNTGEFTNMGVRDSYRRSLEYQQRLASYLASIINSESFLEKLRAECPRQAIIHSIQAFFGNVGQMIQSAGEKISTSINNFMIDKLSDEDIKLLYGVDSKEEAYALTQGEESTFEAVEIELSDEEMAYAIYKFETEELIPTGTIGKELEYTGSFRNYTDTTGLERNVYKELEKRYASEYEEEFTEAVKTFLEEINNDINGSVYGSSDASTDINDTLNPFPGRYSENTYNTDYEYYYNSSYWNGVDTSYTITDTRLDSKYLSSGYIPTSVSYSYGKLLTGIDSESLIDEILKMGNNSSATSGQGDFIVEIGTGEEGNFGYDISKNRHIGETQLMNILDSEQGRKVIRYYTGISISDDLSDLWKLTQRFINVIGEDFSGMFSGMANQDCFKSRTIKLKDGTGKILYTKSQLPQKYEYRTKTSLLDVDEQRFRDASNYEVLPYEVRSVRDYGLASIMEYMEGLSVVFKRGLYYDEQYQAHAVNAFVYYLQTLGNSGEIDVSNYKFGDPKSGEGIHSFYTDLERGFYPAEYMDVGGEGSDLLHSEFILGGAEALADKIGQGAASQVTNNTTEITKRNPDAKDPEASGIAIIGDSSVAQLNASVGLESMGIEVHCPTPGMMATLNSGDVKTDISTIVESAVNKINGSTKKYNAVFLFAGMDQIMSNTNNYANVDTASSEMNKYYSTILSKFKSLSDKVPHLYVIGLHTIKEIEGSVQNHTDWSWLPWVSDSGGTIAGMNNTLKGLLSGMEYLDIAQTCEAFWTDQTSDKYITDSNYFMNSKGYLKIWNDVIYTKISGLNLNAVTFESLSANAKDGDNIGQLISVNGEKYYIFDKYNSKMKDTEGNLQSVIAYNVMSEGNAYQILYEFPNGSFSLSSDTHDSSSTERITGTFFNDGNSIPTNGTIENQNSLLYPYYNQTWQGKVPRVTSIYFDCFVPFMKEDTKNKTYQSPTDFYLNWVERDKSEETDSTAQQLAAARTWIVKEDLEKSEGVASAVKNYFKGDSTDINWAFASNLLRANGNMVYTELYTKQDWQTTEKQFLNHDSFGLNTMDTSQFKHAIDKAQIVDDYSALINDFTYMDMTSTESMFLISQAVTFLGRFEYTYKDKLESQGPLSKYDEARLIGLYYYDRYLESDNLQYLGVYWRYSFQDTTDSQVPTLGDTLSKNVLAEINDSPKLEQAFRATLGSDYDDFMINGYVVVEAIVRGSHTTYTTTIDPDTGEESESSDTKTYYRVIYKYPEFEDLNNASNDANAFFLSNSNNAPYDYNVNVRIYDDLMSGDYDLGVNFVPIDMVEEYFRNESVSMYRTDGETADISKQIKLSYTENGDEFITIPKKLDYTQYCYNGWADKNTNRDTFKKTATGHHTDNKGGNSEFEYEYYPSGMKEYSSTIPAIMKFCNKDATQDNREGTIPDNASNWGIRGVDNRTTGKTGPLKRHYYGATWKIYLKEMAAYYDGETLPSWGERVLYTAEDFAGVNPDYADFEKELEEEKESKIRYFESYLKYFETYIPTRLKTDSDLQDRIDLVQNFASLTADGKLETTKDISSMFINESSQPYWDNVYKVWDSTFKDLGLANISDNQKRKAFAQILQGIWEVRTAEAIKKNLEYLSTTYGVDTENADNIEVMKEIMLLSCSYADPVKGVQSIKAKLPELVKKFKGTNGEDLPGASGIEYEDIQYLGWGGIYMPKNKIGYNSNIAIDATEEPYRAKNGIWYSGNIDDINHQITLVSEGGKIVKDNRLIANEVMTFIANRLLQNLNLYLGIHQAIYATVLTQEDADIIVKSGKDLTLVGSYDKGDVITQVFSYVKNKSVRQTLSMANVTRSEGWFVERDGDAGREAMLGTKTLGTVDSEFTSAKGYSSSLLGNSLEKYWSDYSAPEPGREIFIPVGEPNYRTTSSFTYESWNPNFGYFQGFFKETIIDLLGGEEEIYDKYGIGKVGDRFVVATTPSVGMVGDYIDVYFDGIDTPLPCIVGDCKNSGDMGGPKLEYGHPSGDSCNVLEFMVNASTENHTALTGTKADGSQVVKYDGGSNDPLYEAVYEQLGTSSNPKKNVIKVINLGSFFSDPSYAGTSAGQSTLAVSSRSNIAAQLKQLNLRDYRAFTATSLELVSRPQTVFDIEQIYINAPNFKTEPEKSLEQMSFDEIFGKKSTFNLLDLLGNLNGEGIYHKKSGNKVSFEYLFTGVYDGIDLGAITWTEGDHIGSTDIVAVALREAANEDDEQGAKYWQYMGFGGWVNWCACFVQWCAGKLNYNIAGGILVKGAGCTSLSQNYGYPTSHPEKIGSETTWVTPDDNPNPVAGDLIFFSKVQNMGVQLKHIELVIGSDGDRVYTVGGNTSNESGNYSSPETSPPGIINVVRVKSYPLSYAEIAGYIIPDYTKIGENPVRTLEDALDENEIDPYVNEGYGDYFNSIDLG